MSEYVRERNWTERRIALASLGEGEQALAACFFCSATTHKRGEKEYKTLTKKEKTSQLIV